MLWHFCRNICIDADLLNENAMFFLPSLGKHKLENCNCLSNFPFKKLLWIIFFFSLDDNVRVVTEQRGVYDVINALKAHRQSAQLVESACAALIAISMEGMGDKFKYVCDWARD